MVVVFAAIFYRCSDIAMSDLVILRGANVLSLGWDSGSLPEASRHAPARCTKRLSQRRQWKLRISLRLGQSVAFTEAFASHIASLLKDTTA